MFHSYVSSSPGGFLLVPPCFSFRTPVEATGFLGPWNYPIGDFRGSPLFFQKHQRSQVRDSSNKGILNGTDQNDCDGFFDDQLDVWAAEVISVAKGNQGNWRKHQEILAGYQELLASSIPLLSRVIRLHWPLVLGQISSFLWFC